MKPSTWLRIAAGLQAFGTLGHNLATLSSKPTRGAPEQVVFDAMHGFQFDTMGSTRSTWDFYRGYQFSTTVTFVLTVVLLWLLSNMSNSAPREAKPLVSALLIAQLLQRADWVGIFLRRSRRRRIPNRNLYRAGDGRALPPRAAGPCGSTIGQRIGNNSLDKETDHG